MENIPQIIQPLLPMVHQYGYLAIGGMVLLEDFGLPVPGETTLIAGAFFAGLGHLNIILVIIVAFACAVFGDNIGFTIGEYGGEPLIKRYGKYIFLTRERIKKATDFFDKHGGKVIIIARFVEGLRQANGIIAGMSAMRWRRFLSFNAIGAAIWVILWSAAGFYGGNHINTFLRYQAYFALAVAAIILGLIVYKIISRKWA